MYCMLFSKYRGSCSANVFPICKLENKTRSCVYHEWQNEEIREFLKTKYHEPRKYTLWIFHVSVIFVRTYMVSTEGHTRACYREETKIRYCWLKVVGGVCVKKKN